LPDNIFAATTCGKLNDFHQSKHKETKKCGRAVHFLELDILAEILEI